MKRTHYVKLSHVMILIFGFASMGLISQTTLEINYYQPFEAAGGGFMEENSLYVLLCNAQQSLFISATDTNVESIHEGEDGNYDLQFWLAIGDAWIYKNFSKKSLVQYATSIQGHEYLIDDLIHPMHWNILAETKQIQGITVQRARGAHRGRTYTAWFAPSIPLNNGPWKLGGLPGLILEAYDDEKEVVFLFKSLKQINDQSIEMPSAKGRKVSLKTYLELSKTEFKQYIDFMEARLKSVSTDIEIDVDFKNYSSWEYLY